MDSCVRQKNVAPTVATVGGQGPIKLILEIHISGCSVWHV